MKISIKDNLKDVMRTLDGIAKRQVPYAAMLALNQTAFQIKKETEREMPRYIDRPTPWTLKSVRYTKATKQRLEASIWFDPWGNKRAITADRWLGPHIFGGPRRTKAFEERLRRAGILPDGMFVVPSKAVTLDRYGNVPGSFLVRVLSRLGAAEQFAGATMNQTVASRKRRMARRTRRVEFFVAGPGTPAAHLHPGIWTRTYFGFGTSVRPIFLFVRQPRYRQRFPFFEIGERVKARAFPVEFDKALAAALRTAR